MPQELVRVYAVEDGMPKDMHSVDAKEAVALGDYTYAAPNRELSDQEKMQAAFAIRGAQTNIHPELMSPEDREAMRKAANETAAAQAAMQHPVVVTQGHVAMSVTDASQPEEAPKASRAASRDRDEKK